MLLASSSPPTSVSLRALPVCRPFSCFATQHDGRTVERGKLTMPARLEPGALSAGMRCYEILLALGCRSRSRAWPAQELASSRCVLAGGHGNGTTVLSLLSPNRFKRLETLDAESVGGGTPLGGQWLPARPSTQTGYGAAKTVVRRASKESKENKLLHCTPLQPTATPAA